MIVSGGGRFGLLLEGVIHGLVSAMSLAVGVRLLQAAWVVVRRYLICGEVMSVTPLFCPVGVASRRSLADCSVDEVKPRSALPEHEPARARGTRGYARLAR